MIKEIICLKTYIEEKINIYKRFYDDWNFYDYFQCKVVSKKIIHLATSFHWNIFKKLNFLKGVDYLFWNDFIEVLIIFFKMQIHEYINEIKINQNSIIEFIENDDSSRKISTI